MILRDVIINKLLAIKIDGDSEDALTHESDFTFNRMDGLEYFKTVEN